MYIEPAKLAELASLVRRDDDDKKDDDPRFSSSRIISIVRPPSLS